MCRRSSDSASTRMAQRRICLSFDRSFISLPTAILYLPFQLLTVFLFFNHRTQFECGVRRAHKLPG
jgi:hypothetical protein